MKRTLIAVLLTIAAAIPALAQRGPNPADFTVTPAERKEAIEGSIARLKEGYVFPKVALEMEKAVLDRMKKGEYDAITSANELAKKLTDDFRAVSNDKHLRVMTDADGVPDDIADEKPPTAEQIAQMKRNGARINYGLEKVERLDGNIGYIEIRGFAPPAIAAATGAAAMNFIANTDALIVDLRRNGGGEPAMIAFLTSYLFDAPTHLNDIYTETSKSTQQYWTLPYVPGDRFGGTKPIYVLTSKRTFSGGEEFANNLKELKRATILGETTGGGAHPVNMFKASRRFAIGVPFARAINPISKTNWEGTGVTPHLSLPADQAFDRAYLMALEEVVKTTDNPRFKSQIEKLIAEKKK